MSTTTPPIHVILDAIRECSEAGATAKLTPQETEVVVLYAEFGFAALFHLERGLPMDDLISIGKGLGLLDPRLP